MNLKKKVRNFTILTSVFLVLLLLVFVSPLKGVIGATMQPFTVTLSLGNTAPAIVYVESKSTTPADGATKTLYITFNASDSNGYTDINLSSAQAVINYSGTTKNSTSCAQDAAAGNVMQINCSITLYYFDTAGAWSLNVSVNDNSGLAVYNSTETTTVGTLQAIQINPSSISFGTGLTQGQTNVSSTNDPLYVNNTGNQNFAGVNITAIDLAGTTNSSEIVPAANFTVNATSDSWGVSLVNETEVVIPGTTLNYGDNSYVSVYFYLKELPSDISIQTYDTSTNGDWEVSVT